jgi:hypothetical protein
MGWRAFLAGELNEDERDAEVLMCSRECARCEFSPCDAGRLEGLSGEPQEWRSYNAHRRIWS